MDIRSTTASTGCRALRRLGAASSVPRAGQPVTARSISHRAGRRAVRGPGTVRDLVEITCQRWKRSVQTGSRRARAASPRRLRRHRDRRDPGRDARAARLAARLVEAAAELHRGRHPRRCDASGSITYASTHATFIRHARRGLQRCRGDSHRARALEPGRTRRPRARWRRCCSRRMRAHGLPEPVLQFEVLDENGSFVARADAALPQWRVTIEYQSMQEHLDEFQVAADDRRRNQRHGRRILATRRALRRPASPADTSSPTRSAPSSRRHRAQLA